MFAIGADQRFILIEARDRRQRRWGMGLYQSELGSINGLIELLRGPSGQTKITNRKKTFRSPTSKSNQVSFKRTSYCIFWRLINSLWIRLIKCRCILWRISYWVKSSVNEEGFLLKIEDKKNTSCTLNEKTIGNLKLNPPKCLLI